MSLYDHITPSEQAVELNLVTNRVRRQTGLDIVPMLVVEGATDESLLSQICLLGDRQIFPAGTRDLVEQLLRHLKREPIDGVDCVFLVDCDGKGKTVALAQEHTLLVTETCDIEADLVRLGVATRLTREYVLSDAEAADLVKRACDLAMQLSTVRRAAHAASISMKVNQRQLRLTDLPEIHLSAWEETLPSPTDVISVVGAELEWTLLQEEEVANRLEVVSLDFTETCMGKDALDALFRLLRDQGQGDARGWAREYFYKVVRSRLELSDLDQWQVGQRLRAWQKTRGRDLLKA